MSRPIHRRLPIGAELQRGNATHFRVWAPDPREVGLVLEARSGPCREVALEREPNGYYSALVPGAGAGDRYRYRLDGRLLADPASRFQPDGPDGPSEIIDPLAFPWTDLDWCGLDLPGQIVYELHVGTFTAEGTWSAAVERLPDLARTGISVIEVMPVAEFPGEFGWGYDGVFPYAPTHLYGAPDDFRAFVARAHHLRLSVILDVVYNHLGPAGCVLNQYAKAYFAKHYANEWGDGLNYDGPDSGPVREYFSSNAGYWIDEFHLDGLRLDATQSIHDTSQEHVVAVIGRSARKAAGNRRIILLAENEPQHARVVRALDAGGYGLDALWNDDFHHSAVVTLTGRREAYYSDHHGTPQELISAAKHGFLFQGQRYAWQRNARGTRTDGVSPAAFVNFIENHDQLANGGDGCRVRVRTTPGRYRAMTAVLLLIPGTPMLFQGQEFGASSPFLFFADHAEPLATAVRKGRAQFMSQFPSLASPEVQACLPLPHDRATFERCKLDWREHQADSTHWRLHHDLISLRRSDEAFRAQRPGAVDGAVLAQGAFVLRFLTPDNKDERLLLVNFGPDLVAPSLAEPLLGPPEGCDWATRWSSEHPDYGGLGTPAVAHRDGWTLPGHSAIVLAPTVGSLERDGTAARPGHGLRSETNEQ
jgi:maltooligosyltrehalose trehalohydrolase